MHLMHYYKNNRKMKKFICYLCGGIAAFNLIVIFPALMSGASASWAGERFLYGLIFGVLCFIFSINKKEKGKIETPIMTVNGNKKQETNSIITQNRLKTNREDDKHNPLEFSPATDVIAKYLFKIASSAIQEIINASGRLNEKGLCEAIMFNSNIILNDPILHQKPFYKAVSEDYLLLLYHLIQQYRTDLKDEELANFINERMEFYFSEYNKLVNEKQATPMWVYSIFYLAPLEDEPKPCLDNLQVMTFQVGLIRMACTVHELLDKLLNKDI